MTDTTIIQPRSLRVAYLGNFGPEHSTENHVRKAWINNGHQVETFQEDVFHRWADLCNLMRSPTPPDLVMWTSTAGLAAKIPDGMQREMLATALHAGIPTVGYHLDRWWGLDRQHQITERQWFKCELVITADGDHAHEWIEAGVNHCWFPPGVSRDEALREPSERAGRYARFDVAFVGSWQSYHPEWLPYRQALIPHLVNWYGDRLLLVEGGLRGQGLIDLYRTVPVIVGDSCLAPTVSGGGPWAYYSDRVPETMGRGGYLIHPDVGCFDLQFTDPVSERYCGPDGYPLYDFDYLGDLIADALKQESGRAAHAAECRTHVLEHHTYERRMEQVIEELAARKMLAVTV
jgi:hypothetical protein